MLYVAVHVWVHLCLWHQEGSLAYRLSMEVVPRSDALLVVGWPSGPEYPESLAGHLLLGLWLLPHCKVVFPDYAMG